MHRVTIVAAYSKWLRPVAAPKFPKYVLWWMVDGCTVSVGYMTSRKYISQQWFSVGPSVVQQRMIQEGSGGLETSLVSSKRTGPSVSPGWEMVL